MVCESHSVVSDSLHSLGLHSPWNPPGLEWVAFPFSRGSSHPSSPTLQAVSLPAEPREKPKSTRVGSLSLLQQIFLMQESNWGLLYCRWILYQLSYQGSPKIGPLLWPGNEPESAAWKAAMLTTIPPTLHKHISNILWSFILEGDHLLLSPHEKLGIMGPNIIPYFVCS